MDRIRYFSREKWVEALLRDRILLSPKYISLKVKVIKKTRESFCKNCIVDANCSEMCQDFATKVNDLSLNLSRGKRGSKKLGDLYEKK